MGVKNASSCMKMAASLIAITCVLLGITPANSQEKTYDYGMDPTIVKNPADNDLPRAQGPFHKIPKLGSLLTRGGSSDNTTFELYSSQEPQETNPMFPAGRSHLPTATIDMNPEVLARLREWAKVDGTKIRQINAYSPSMGRTIPLVWIPAKDTSQPRPVLYALGGGDGGQGENNWITRTDMVDYMRERNVHVIMPMLGAYSLYSDWETELPAQGGKQMWETFLTHELPEPLEKAIGANGKRSLIGMSMSGATALIYATHQPGFYDSVGSLSGCGLTNSWVGRRTVAATVYNAPAGPDDPWGPMDSPQSRYNDVYINAEKLADQPNLYVFSASGTYGINDMSGPNAPKEWEKKDRRTAGFQIEAAANYCNHLLKSRTDSLGIRDNISWDFRLTGTHSWGYWQDALHRFWPIMARGFGLDGGSVPDMDTDGEIVDGSSALTTNDLLSSDSVLSSED